MEIDGEREYFSSFYNNYYYKCYKNALIKATLDNSDKIIYIQYNNKYIHYYGNLIQTNYTISNSENKAKLLQKYNENDLFDPIIEDKDGVYNSYNNYNLCDINFDNNIKYLCLGHYFNNSILNFKFPEKLNLLRFGHHFNNPIIGSILPKSLKILQFSSSFNQPIINANLPQELEYLEFGTHFNQSITNANFPQSLITIVFGELFNEPLINVNLPTNLSYIYLSDDSEDKNKYDDFTYHDSLPKSIHKIISYGYNDDEGKYFINKTLYEREIGQYTKRFVIK